MERKEHNHQKKQYQSSKEYFIGLNSAKEQVDFKKKGVDSLKRKG